MRDINDTTKPYWEHDCDNCEFLGGYIGPQADWTDLRHGRRDMYFCARPVEPDGGSVVDRKSDEPSDYASGPRKMIGRGGFLGYHPGELIAAQILDCRDHYRKQTD